MSIVAPADGIELDRVRSSAVRVEPERSLRGIEGKGEGDERSRTTSFLVRRTEPVEGFDSPSGQKNDGLQDTKAFYGLSPAQPSPSRDPSRQSHTRTLSMSTRFSSASRPKSPDSTMSHGTNRTSMPLPLNRGFLTPKKPSSMPRLDGDGRRRTSSRLSQTSDLGHSARHTSPLVKQRPLTEVRESADLDTALERSTGATGISPTGASFAQNNRYSVAEVSTNGGGTQIPEASSDDLVEDQHELEKAGNPQSHRMSGIGRKSSSRTRQRASKITRKRYETFDNPLTSWWLGGRVMIGGDRPWSVAFTLVILFGITGVWLGTSGVWYWRNGDRYGLARGAGIAIVIVFAYLFGLTFSSFLAAALRDPGIIPRDLDPIDLQAEDGNEEDWDGPLDRQFAVKAGTVTVRYCDTCRSYRPPRGSHCRMCGNCVDGIDHHCSYLHTCVGKRTYMSFLTLLIAATISAVYEIVFSAIHFSLLCHVDNISFSTALRQSPGAAVSFLLGVLVLPAICFLLYYHVRLVMYNITTVEQIRASHNSKWYKSRVRPNNPFAENTMPSNILLATLARPQFPSWVGADKVIKEDKRDPNPALTEDRWVRAGYSARRR